MKVFTEMGDRSWTGGPYFWHLWGWTFAYVVIDSIWMLMVPHSVRMPKTLLKVGGQQSFSQSYLWRLTHNSSITISSWGFVSLLLASFLHVRANDSVHSVCGIPSIPRTAHVRRAQLLLCRGTSILLETGLQLARRSESFLVHVHLDYHSRHYVSFLVFYFLAHWVALPQ